MVTVIWFALAVLGFLAIHTVVERVLYHTFCDEVAPQLFVATQEQWRAMKAIRPLPRLGRKRKCWMEVLFERAEGRRSVFEMLCHEERRRAERFDAFLPMLANTATGFGLLGTVVAMASMQGADMDVATILAVGMGSTKWGLIIAIPVTVVHALLCRRAARLVGQIDVMLDLVREIASHRAQESAKRRMHSGKAAITMDVSRNNRIVEHVTVESVASRNGKSTVATVRSLPDRKCHGTCIEPEDGVMDR